MSLKSTSCIQLAIQPTLALNKAAQQIHLLFVLLFLSSQLLSQEGQFSFLPFAGWRVASTSGDEERCD